MKDFTEELERMWTTGERMVTKRTFVDSILKLIEERLPERFISHDESWADENYTKAQWLGIAKGYNQAISEIRTNLGLGERE